MKLFIKSSFILTFIFLIISTITSSHYIYSAIFKLTHKNWIKINDFQVIDYKVYCSSAPWRRGMDRSARGDLKFKYRYNNKIYTSEKEDFLVIYRLNIFENCNEIKSININTFNEIKKNNEIFFLISPNINKSKILITKKGLSFRSSWMINLFLEIQLIFFILIGLIIYLSMTSKK